MPSLEEYKRKRNFTKTPEPSEEIGKTFYDEILPKLKDKKFPRPLYMIHRHESRKLHFDLRLEFKGVLESWAIPKEPPKEPGIKRLAILVEPHPLLYGLWHGRIPPGNYGAGTVKIWDTGTFETIEITDNAIVVNLKGKKLKGQYILVKTTFRGSKNSWLFFKKKE